MHHSTQFRGIFKMNTPNCHIFLSWKYGNVNYGTCFDFNAKYYQLICNINVLIRNSNSLSEKKVVNLRLNVVFNHAMLAEEKCYQKCHKSVYLVFSLYFVFVTVAVSFRVLKFDNNKHMLLFEKKDHINNTENIM